MLIQRFYAMVLVFVLVLSVSVTQSSFCVAEVENHKLSGAPEYTEANSVVRPLIYHPDKIDADFNGVEDGLEAMISRVANDSTMLRVVVTLYEPVSSRDLNYFIMLGGHVTQVYRYVTYGFAGEIPAVNISRFAGLDDGKLAIIEYDSPIRYHLDVSVPLIRARPTVWNTYGYKGSSNHSIVIIDTGIDDSHPDLGPFGNLNFSRKLVGWYDATADGALAPQDYGEHGTHVAGIAAGTGAANPLQGYGNVQTTFTYRLPQANWGYADYFDVMNPGTITMRCSWGGSNTLGLRLDNPAGTAVAQKSSKSQPLTLTYSTVGTSYPTGRYRVVVFNLGGPSGVPFSCTETYLYKGLNDGYNLFTGVAPDSKLVGVKVFDNTGSGTLSTLMAGMDWVVQNRIAYHIVVASMSLGLETGAVDSTLDQKADTMVNSGIVTTVSAGNDFPDYTIGSPGTAAYVITVAATNDQNGITDYSSNGDISKNEFGLIKPDVEAPGGTFSLQYGNRIVSADSNDVDMGYSNYADQNVNDYQQMAGTSMSAPHVAGLAALIAQALGSWDWTLEEALKVKMLISMTAFETQSGEGTNQPSLNRGEKDSKEGYGRINADAAIEAATMAYDTCTVATDTLGVGFAEKKVWARRVFLFSKTKYTFQLEVPSGADYDLFLYCGVPDGYGQPIILKRSVNASVGTDEALEYTPVTSGDFYIVVKQVSGSGSFTLRSSSQLPQHDVGIVRLVPSTSEVYAGATLNITVYAKNYGSSTETFSVTAYYGTSVLGTQTVFNLPTGAEKNVTFSWNTTSVNPSINYIIKVEAEVLSGETDLSDNVYVDGVVKVKMLGDVNGDGAVSIMDLALVSRRYGVKVGDVRYNTACDLNNDGKIWIEDIAIVSKNYGKTY